MKLGVQFDENGNFVGDFLEGMSLPDGHTLVEGNIPEGFFSPKWNGTEVVEGLTQEEIDAIRNVPVPESELEKTQRMLADLNFELMIKGVI